MKYPTRPVEVIGCGITVIDGFGAAVGSRRFPDIVALCAWLSNWRFSLAPGGSFLLAVNVRNYPVIGAFVEHARPDDCSLRINVHVGGAVVTTERALELVVEGRIARERRSEPGVFRTGPVPGTGKRRTYRYFRRKIATFTDRRDAYLGLEEGGPPVRAARNDVNLPDGRDDISRCLTRCWKKTRRHQWRADR